MNSVFKKLILCVILATAFLTLHASASTPVPPAMPRDYVVDLAGIIRDDAKSKLNAYLAELEQKTTAQVLVLTVQSLDGEDIEFLRGQRKNELHKVKDNGSYHGRGEGQKYHRDRVWARAFCPTAALIDRSETGPLFQEIHFARGYLPLILQ
jgi:hypothetical protein